MKKDMSALPEPVKSFNEELAEMLTQKPPVSSSKMKDITRSAMKGQKYYKHIVMSVEKLIQKCKPEFKLSGIYVIDAIVRQSRHQYKDKDVYGARFEANLHTTATHLFRSSHGDQVKICRTFKLWELNKVFSYHSIQKCLNNAAPDIRKEGVQLAEDSFAKMNVDKPAPVNPDIKKQQMDLEEQRRKILEQQEELKRKQEALLHKNSSAIPPILGNLLHFGQAASEQNDEPTIKAAETAKKVKSLLDDFDYSDEDEIKQPGKKGTPKMKSPQPSSTPKKSENVATPSPVTAAHNTSIYEPDPPSDATTYQPAKSDKYDTKSLEKLYTPSPVEKTNKRSKHKSPEKVREKEKKSYKSDRSSSGKRDSDRSRDKSRERSRDRSKEDKSSSRKRGSPEKRHSKGTSRSGKRSRSASPDHFAKKRERISKIDCVTVLSLTIWIGNLRKTVTREDVASLMKKYTDSCSIDMVPPRGCAYINIGSRDTAETVLREFKDLKLHGATCKVAWAPGKGCKEFKDHWNIEKGATFIPFKTFEKLKISTLEDGGEILETTLPHGYRIEDRRREEKRSRVKNPLLALNLPSNISVFSSQLPAPDDAQSDEEMTDAFSPIPILPVPAMSDPTPSLVVQGLNPSPNPLANFMPTMSPLVPPQVAGQAWLAPTPGNQPVLQTTPAIQQPPAFNIGYPIQSPVTLPNIPTVSVANFNHIALPGTPIPTIGGQPSPLPGTNFPNPALAFMKPLVTPQSPLPKPPFTLERPPSPGVKSTLGDPSKIHAGSLPSFSRSTPNGTGLSQNSRVHAGSLPPFNDSVSLRRSSSPPVTNDPKPGFINPLQAPAPNPPAGFINSMQPAPPVTSRQPSSPRRSAPTTYSSFSQNNAGLNSSGEAVSKGPHDSQSFSPRRDEPNDKRDCGIPFDKSQPPVPGLIFGNRPLTIRPQPPQGGPQLLPAPGNAGNNAPLRIPGNQGMFPPPDFGGRPIRPQLDSDMPRFGGRQIHQNNDNFRPRNNMNNMRPPPPNRFNGPPPQGFPPGGNFNSPRHNFRPRGPRQNNPRENFGRGFRGNMGNRPFNR